MEITVSARHTEVSPALREAVEEKINRLAKKVYGLDRADVHFEEERNPRIIQRETCEIALEGHGNHLRCRVNGSDGFVALDRAVAKLDAQIQKAKTRKINRRFAAARRSEVRREIATGNGSSNGVAGNGRVSAYSRAPRSFRRAV